MRFEELLHIIGDEPLFSSSVLRVGDIDLVDVSSQLSRWVAAGRLVRLRRGVYVLAEPYRKRAPHGFEIANMLVRPSYVSLESALSYHGLIPEAVFTTTSITTGRPATFDTPSGRYAYRHVAPGMMWGYRQVGIDASGKAEALVATPEKALLDLVYLRPGADSPAFLRQLRLEPTNGLDLQRLESDARRTGKPKLERAVERIIRMAEESSEGETRR